MEKRSKLLKLNQFDGLLICTDIKFFNMKSLLAKISIDTREFQSTRHNPKYVIFFFQGGTAVIPSKFSASNFWPLMANHRCT